MWLTSWAGCGQPSACTHTRRWQRGHAFLLINSIYSSRHDWLTQMCETHGCVHTYGQDIQSKQWEPFCCIKNRVPLHFPHAKNCTNNLPLNFTSSENGALCLDGGRRRNIFYKQLKWKKCNNYSWWQTNKQTKTKRNSRKSPSERFYKNYGWRTSHHLMGKPANLNFIKMVKKNLKKSCFILQITVMETQLVTVWNTITLPAVTQGRIFLSPPKSRALAHRSVSTHLVARQMLFYGHFYCFFAAHFYPWTECTVFDRWGQSRW